MEGLLTKEMQKKENKDKDMGQEEVEVIGNRISSIAILVTICKIQGSVIQEEGSKEAISSMFSNSKYHKLKWGNKS